MRSSNMALNICLGPLLCAYIGFAACFCPQKLRRRTLSGNEDRKRFERRQRMAPRPKPQRKRALTIGNDSASLCPAPAARAQLQCRLFSLPLEIRQMIFRTVVGDRAVHLLLQEHRLGHLRCRASSADGCAKPGLTRVCVHRGTWGTADPACVWCPRNSKLDQTDGGILPLLLTCRQIYSEAIDFVYSSTTFAVSDLDCLRHLCATTLPQRFSLIQSLELEWVFSWPIYDPTAQHLLGRDSCLYPPHGEATWEEIWRIIATKMTGLRNLRVSLFYFEGFRVQACETRMLAPLWQVKNVRDFDVYVSWSGGAMPDAPFRLVGPKPPSPPANLVP